MKGVIAVVDMTWVKNSYGFLPLMLVESFSVLGSCHYHGHWLRFLR